MKMMMTIMTMGALAAAMTPAAAQQALDLGFGGGESVAKTAAAGAEVAGSDTVVVKGVGVDKTAALKDAYRNAVEKVAGLYIDAESQMQNMDELEERVNTISNADIKHYEILKERTRDGGLYEVTIKAEVERKAVAAKFKGVAGFAMADVGDGLKNAHAQIVSKEVREKDATALFAAALKDVDPIRQWTKLSFLTDRTKVMDEIVIPHKEKRSPNPGEKWVSLSYTISYDKDVYFNKFLPHFVKTLDAIKTGNKKTRTLQVQPLVYEDFKNALPRSDLDLSLPGGLLIGDDGHGVERYIDYVAPFAAKGWLAGDESDYNVFHWNNGRIKKNKECYLWVANKIKSGNSLVKVDAYPVGKDIVIEYLKWMGALVMDECKLDVKEGKPRYFNGIHKEIEVNVTLLDDEGDEIKQCTDTLPLESLFLGIACYGNDYGQPTKMHAEDDFDKIGNYFIKPYFVAGQPSLHNRRFKTSDGGACFSDTVMRQVYIPVKIDDLPKIKSVKVEFAE